MRKFLLITLIIASVLSGTSYAAEKYDPQHTMLALNMAIVSVHKILAAKDRLVLDQEYQNIINNLSLGNIRSDSEITQLYEKLMDIVVQKKLRQEEAEQVKKRFDLQMSKRFSEAMSEAAKNSLTALDKAHRSTFALGVGLLRIIPACAASYFKYQTREKELRSELDESIYRLKLDDMAVFNDMQKQLLSSSWNLLNIYHLPDEFRLVQKALDDFYRAVEENDTPSRRFRMLAALEDDFKAYPPYWFYRARTALEINDKKEADRCLDKFDEVWRPVLRRDPYKLEVTKYRISELVKDGIPSDKERRQKIFALASVMRDNTMREDWANNLFAGILYYSLGDKVSAEKCIQMNIDFRYEHDMSYAMLSNIRKSVNASSLLQDTLRTMNLTRLLAGMNSKDIEAAYLVADYFDRREWNEDSYKRNADNLLILHLRRLVNLRMGNKPAFKSLCDLAKTETDSSEVIPEVYSAISVMIKHYADEGNISAQIYLADMYNYGWGVPKDSEQAMGYYYSAAEKGDVYSQFMYMHLLLDESSQPSINPDEALPGKTFTEVFELATQYYNEGRYINAYLYFSMLASQGHAEASYMLGQMLENGQGVAVNPGAAKAWYRLASQKGHEMAKEALERLRGGWWPF